MKPILEIPSGIGRKERQALDVLELSWPTNLAEVKQRYKALVKKHHPDKNQQTTTSKERFIRIKEAYEHLRKSPILQEG